METITQNNTSNKPPDIGQLSLTAKNIFFIIGALVSFSLWLSSTISTPKRIDKLEETIMLLNYKNQKMEAQVDLIYSDLKEIKTLLINKTK